jgi:hypothetical protein
MDLSAMTSTPSTILRPGMVAFPEAESVFSGNVAAHRAVLQPLLSLDASTIDPAWSGRLHFVTPMEPYDGLLGDNTPTFHSGYCTLNWIGFRVHGSKYEFLGDFRYFEINADPSDFIRSDYEEKEKSYLESARLFHDEQRLGSPINPPISVEWFDELGGDAYAGNWTAFGLNVEFSEVENEQKAHPLTQDGRRFRYVGCLAGYNYRKNCADRVLLFFDPQEHVAVITFD